MVESGGPAGVSRSTTPSSIAICAARAAIGLVTEANAKTFSTLPCVANTPVGPITAAAAAGTGQSSRASRAAIVAVRHFLAM